MTKRLIKALKDANKKIAFKNFEIRIEGDFSDEYNNLVLASTKTSQQFPISSVANEAEAIVSIDAYLSGLNHGADQSYPNFCDRN